MSKTLSIFLDALRFLAAIIVVLGHFTEPMFSRVWQDHTVDGVSSVGVFFVLSGFVISFVSTRKEDHAFDYAVARISRLYSVLVPAVILSTLVLIVAMKLDPGYLTSKVTQPFPQVIASHHRVAAIAIRSLLPLTFLNAFHFNVHPLYSSLHELYPPLDSPIWSLGFEAAYYGLFGIAIFSRGVVRVVLLVITAYFAGVAILHLLPIWLAGVALHRLGRRMKSPPVWSFILGFLCFAGAAALCLEWQPLMLWCGAYQGYPLHSLLNGRGRAGPAYLFYAGGALGVLLILGTMFWEPLLGIILQPMEKPIRWCANHTFSLYLFHYPIFVLLYVLIHYNRSSPAICIAICCADIFLCMLLSKLSEEKKLWWRSVIRSCLSRLLPRTRALPLPPSQSA